MPRMTKAQLEDSIEYFDWLMNLVFWRESFAMIRCVRAVYDEWARKFTVIAEYTGGTSFASILDNITTGYMNGERDG